MNDDTNIHVIQHICCKTCVKILLIKCKFNTKMCFNKNAGLKVQYNRHIGFLLARVTNIVPTIDVLC